MIKSWIIQLKIKNRTCQERVSDPNKLESEQKADRSFGICLKVQQTPPPRTDSFQYQLGRQSGFWLGAKCPENFPYYKGSLGGCNVYERFRWSHKSLEIFLRTFLRKHEFLIFFTTQSNSIEIIKSEIKYFEFIESKKNCLSLEELLKLFPIGIFPMEIFSIEDFPIGIFTVWLPPIRTPVRVFRMKKLAVLGGGSLLYKLARFGQK